MAEKRTRQLGQRCTSCPLPEAEGKRTLSRSPSIRKAAVSTMALSAKALPLSRWHHEQ